ncbi:MAG: NAD(P)/FAD-dependent oxidoreductase [Bdellovibrionota bacterium]
MQARKTSKSISIVGAGPVGSLLAVFLSRRGHKVTLFERRPDMRKETISAGRSINLAVSTRGLHALSQLGLEEEVLKQAIPMRGRLMHAVQGNLTFQAYGKEESEFINSVSRGALNKLLLSKAEESSHAKVVFNERVTGADFETSTLHLKNERTGERTEFTSDFIIGTDGSASAVRSEMLRRPGYVSSEEKLNYGYKELHIAPAERGGFRLEKNALHIWPRGTFMLIALPNHDGSFTCTLFLPFEGMMGFSALNTAREISSFFEGNFPDVVPLLPDLSRMFFENPTGHMVTVKCYPWSVVGRALLMGDAAHAIVPFFGQGMNCGFEDCTVLMDCLDECREDFTGAFHLFEKRRKPNSDAIADMAVENFTEMRDKVGDPRFLLEKAIEKRLQEKFPNRYISRYALVTFRREPYRFAYEAGIAQNEILNELCQGISTAEQLDLEKADQLIREKLDPMFGKIRKDVYGS